MTAWAITTIFKSDDGKPSYWTGGNIWMGQLDSIGLLGPIRTWPTKQEAVAGFRKSFGRMPRKCRAVQLTEEQAALVRGTDGTTDAEVDAELVPDLRSPGGRKALGRIIGARKVGSERAGIVREHAGTTGTEADECTATLEADVVDAEVVEHDARKLDKRIRTLAHSIDSSWKSLEGLIAKAKASEIHVALGFKSWPDYIADVARHGMPNVARSVEQRRQVVELLAGQGMSQRAIAAAVGVSQKTVDRDLDQVSHNDSPADQVITDPMPVTGLDGKTYKPKQPKPQPEPQPEPETEQTEPRMTEWWLGRNLLHGSLQLLVTAPGGAMTTIEISAGCGFWETRPELTPSMAVEVAVRLRAAQPDINYLIELLDRRGATS